MTNTPRLISCSLKGSAASSAALTYREQSVRFRKRGHEFTRLHTHALTSFVHTCALLPATRTTLDVPLRDPRESLFPLDSWMGRLPSFSSRVSLAICLSRAWDDEGVRACGRIQPAEGAVGTITRQTSDTHLQVSSEEET